MSVSTDGIICFGILGEGIAFPWDEPPYDGNDEEWYMYEVCGYKPPFEAIPSSVLSCSRGYPEEFIPHDLECVSIETEQLRLFCKW